MTQSAPSASLSCAALATRVAALDCAALRAEFQANGEFIAVADFLPAAGLAPLLEALPALEPRVHRNFIPGHKKGGSISRYDLDAHAPAYADFYRSAALKEFLEALCGHALLPCPPDDPHTYALYYYTEPGDHIGFHYDTSYYKGARYTILMGLVDRSTQCKLVCELFKDDPVKSPKHLELITHPGDLVIFNGDKLWHAVTPLGEGEERIALTMEYVTDPDMGTIKRLYSNLKDSFAYFGLRTVFKQVLAGSNRRP